MTPEDLLFNNEDSKVFTNQTDLVNKIIHNPSTSFYNKKIDSVKSLISKIIRGERKLSKKVHQSIMIAVKDNPDIDKKKLEFLNENMVSVFQKTYELKTYEKAFAHKEKVSTKLFIELEKNTKNIEVNCVTSNLNWLNEFIDDIMISAKINNSVFKYLIVDNQAEKNLYTIKDKIKNEGLEDKIEIKLMYEHIGYIKLDEKTRVRTSDVMFPLFEDLVIYRNIPKEFQIKHKLKLSELVAIGTTFYEETMERNFDDFIEDDGSRVNSTIIWFNKIWNAI